MKSKTRILKFATLATLVAGSVSVASAAGLLGQRYVGGTFDWVQFDDNAFDDGRGFNLVLNQPLSANVDLSLSYGYLDTGADVDLGEGGIGHVDASSQALLFSTTLYTQANTFKPFVRLSAGWLRTNVAGRGDNDGVYSIMPGVEVPAGEKASLTLYTSWSNTFDDDLGDEDNGVWDFGAIAEFEIAPKWSLLVQTSIDEDSNWGLSAGALFRF